HRRPRPRPAATPPSIVAAELFAWSAEAACFRFGWRRKRVWLWSLLANGHSLSLGLLSRRPVGIS
ncbi:MAG: hypothetical protein WBV96_05110, partial [Polyangia bacterium]